MTVFTTLTSSNAFSTKQHAIKLQEINLDFQNLKQTVEQLDIEALNAIKEEFENIEIEDLVTEDELETALEPIQNITATSGNTQFTGTLNGWNIPTTDNTINTWPHIACVYPDGTFEGLKRLDFKTSSGYTGDYAYRVACYTGGLLTCSGSLETGGYLRGVYAWIEGTQNDYYVGAFNRRTASELTTGYNHGYRLQTKYWNGSASINNTWNIGGHYENQNLYFLHSETGNEFYINPTGTIGQLNTTIEHLTISDDPLQIGDIVEMTGEIIVNEVVTIYSSHEEERTNDEGEIYYETITTGTSHLEFITDPENTEPWNVCPKIKKCTTKNKKYCGVVTRIFEPNEIIEIGEGIKQHLPVIQRCYKFASHGDCMVRVTDSSIYHVGDTILSDLSILGDEEMITPLKMSCIVGKVSKIINTNYVAVFKA